MSRDEFKSELLSGHLGTNTLSDSRLRKLYGTYWNIVIQIYQTFQRQNNNNNNNNYYYYYY